MNEQKSKDDTIHPDVKWSYRLGSISALVLGIAYIIIIVLYVPVGAPPSAPEARLQYLAGDTTVWWAILGLSVLTDLLFVPVALALYDALKGINKNAMLLASVFVGLFIVLDLAITWTNYASLITLSGNYAAASDDAQRALFVTAAIYPAAMLESTLLGVYIILFPALWILITGLVMLKGNFSQSAGYLGLVTGILGIVSIVGPFVSSSLSLTIIITSVFTTIWVLLVGYTLYRRGQQ